MTWNPNHYNREYERAVAQVLHAGAHKGDRTGTGVTSVFGLQMRWNLNNGFPLVTTKQVFTRPMIEELLWMLSGSTDNNVLKDKNVHIWKEWQDEAGRLGPIYGAQWRRWRAGGAAIDLVEIRKPDDDGAPEGVIVRFPQVDEIKARGKSSGCIVHTNKCGDLRLLDRNADGTYRGQFLDTGAIVNVSRPASTRIDDPYRPTFAGVGYLGEPVGSYTQAELALWRGMIKRCYLETSPAFSLYGAKGVTVAKRWHCFANFHADLSLIPGNERWKNEGGLLHLDKDYFGANQYGPRTVVFLPATDNTSMPGTAIEFRGKRYVSLRECEVATGVSRKVILKEGGDVLTPPRGYNYRRIRYIDQIAAVLKSLKEDPDSRRHVVSAWNVADLPRMALAPCHCLFQFYVADGRLSCQLYQRSADMFLGVPFNIASYALLTHMMAQQLGLDVGEFIWTGGDCHVYDNHREQVELQLSRKGFDYPTLKLNKAPDLFSYRLEDVEFLNYQHHPAIRAEVAV